MKNTKTLEKNNLTIPLSILDLKEKEIRTACSSKINSDCENQIFLLMIPNKQKKVALSCYKKTICIIKIENIKTSK